MRNSRIPFWVSGTHVRAAPSSAEARRAVGDPAGERHRAALAAIADHDVGAPARLDEGGEALGIVLPVGVEHDDRLRRTASPTARSATPAATALPLPPFASRAQDAHAAVAGEPVEGAGDGVGGTVVHQHHLVDVAQAGARHLDRPVRGEHRDHGGHRFGARAQARRHEGRAALRSPPCQAQRHERRPVPPLRTRARRGSSRSARPRRRRAAARPPTATARPAKKTPL